MNPFLAVDPAAAALERTDVLPTLRQAWSGSSAEAIYDHYAARRPGATPSQVLSDVTTDRLVRLPALRVAEARARYGHPAHVCQVDWRSAK